MSDSEWDWTHIKEHPGYLGLFSDNQTEGAIPNGTPIVKAWSEVGDWNETGATGVVLGSLPIPPEVGLTSKYFYWVEWDDAPKRAVGVVSKKIAEREPS